LIEHQTELITQKTQKFAKNAKENSSFMNATEHRRFFEHDLNFLLRLLRTFASFAFSFLA